MPELDVEIDGLTQSVVIARTGRSLQTRIVDWPALADYQRDLMRDWRFDWFTEAADSSRRIAALLVAHSEAVEGLISFQPQVDHFFVHLIESAPHNVGTAKMYAGVPANLFAYVCRESDLAGHDGTVAFDSKTRLVKHYEASLGARRVGRSNRLYLDEAAADTLIRSYFKEGDQWG